MDLADFDYDLPPERIAQQPATPRDAARLLVHDVPADRTEHRHVRDLADLLAPGDLLVVNDTRVVPARLCGRRASGGAVEVLLLGAAPDEDGHWRAWVRPAGRLRPGERFLLEGGAVEATAVQRETGDESRGTWRLALADPGSRTGDVGELVERHGRMPLPPYIERPRGDDPHRAVDRERYQTVYAAARGAIAAPTASFLERAALTLHVGLGTFQPVTAPRLEEHAMHAEAYVLPPSTCAAVERARARGGRVVAVGTTSVRVLEHAADEAGRLVPGSGETRLFLRPGRRFAVVDALLTNFHLPRSTLLVLVAAFAGRERVLALYAEAIAAGYRFYSYGDAMLLRNPVRRG